MKNFLLNLKNNHVAQAGLALILISALQRYPWLLSWLGDDVAKEIQTWIANIKVFALGALALFVKQFNFTGGTKPITTEAAERIKE